nr:hypothetical protein [Candidatus Sigynarchaeota archaeon]
MARKKNTGHGWTPPNAITTLVSVLLVAGGLYLGISGYLHQHAPDLLAIGMDTNDFFVYLSFILPALGWLVLFAGVKSRYL